MELNNLRIGYVPYSFGDRLDHPGDRRRFCYYAKKRNISFEIADYSKEYDLVVVSEGGDLGLWSGYHRGDSKIVYDFIDSFLSIPRWDPKRLFGGLAKFVAGQSKNLQLDYWESLRNMCRRADVVICTTEEQKRDIQQFCQNIHIILDFHTTISRTVKTEYSAGNTFNLVWEGQPQNLQSFYEIKGVLESLKKSHKFALHIVTDLEYKQFLRKFGSRQTIDLTDKLFEEIYLYEWNEDLLSAIVCACDMAIIPLPLADPLYRGKPENKLLLFWRMGVPVITSASPAYVRAMAGCGLPMTCRTSEEWIATLKHYMNDEDARRTAGQQGLDYTRKYYSEESILRRWDEAFASIL